VVLLDDVCVECEWGVVNV